MTSRKRDEAEAHVHDWRSVFWEGHWAGLTVMHMKPNPQIAKGIGVHGCEKCFICGAFKCEDAAETPATIRSGSLELKVPVTVHRISASVTPDLVLRVELVGDWGQTLATLRLPMPNPLLYPSDEFELVPRYPDDE